MPTHFQGQPQEVLALDTYIKITRAFGALTTRLARGGTTEGLTPSQSGAPETLYTWGQ